MTDKLTTNRQKDRQTDRWDEKQRRTGEIISAAHLWAHFCLAQLVFRSFPTTVIELWRIPGDGERSVISQSADPPPPPHTTTGLIVRGGMFNRYLKGSISRIREFQVNFSQITRGGGGIPY